MMGVRSIELLNLGIGVGLRGGAFKEIAGVEDCSLRHGILEMAMPTPSTRN